VGGYWRLGKIICLHFQQVLPKRRDLPTKENILEPRKLQLKSKIVPVFK
jgi:hypothetical protein